MDQIVVAVSSAKRGGPCKECRGLIPRDGMIFKVATEGPTTVAGNGPGVWVCKDCAERYEWSDDAVAGFGIAFRDYVPDVPDDLDLDATVPHGFVKALRHSEYTRWAYWLGRHHAGSG